jgi:phage-related protein
MPGSGQGIELDLVYLSVTGETRQLFDAITDGIKKGQRYADTHPIKLKAKVDVAGTGPVEIPVHANTDGFLKQVQDAHRKAQRSAGPITFDADLNPKPAVDQMALLRRQLARGGNVTVGVELDDAGVASALAGITAATQAVQFAPDLSGFSDQIQNELTTVDFSGVADRLREQLGPVLADVGGPVDIDVAAASARLDELTRNRDIHIGVDVDWIPILLALSTLLALRRQVEINVGIPIEDLLAVDTTLANLTHPRDVKFEIDLDQSSAATAETRLDAIARNRNVQLNVDSAALAGLTALGSHTVTLDVEVNQASLTAVNAALAYIARDRHVSFHADIDADSARTVNELLDRIARRRSVEFNPSLDRSEALRMEILLGLLSRDRHVSFESDGLRGVHRDADDAHRSLTAMSAIKFTGLVAGIGALAPLLLGVAGAAAGAVGVLIGGLAALGPAALAAGATVAVGVQGVGDAFKALAAAQESAAADGQAQATAVASAQEQVVAAHEQVADAIYGVKTAQRTLTDAQKDAKDAAKDIGQAYKDAAHDLEDYTFQVKDASLSEAEAKLSLIEARDEFAKALPADREKAYLRLQRADLRYQESVKNNRDVQADANDALAKGVEGSDKVVSAKDRAAQADQRVADAAHGVEKANQQVEKAQLQVEKAQQALTDATNKTSSAQDKAAAALAKLSPNAQEFVLAAREAKPAWEDLTHAVQDKLFDGAAAGIGDLVKNSLPTLKAGMVDVAGSINGLTKDFAAFWQAPQNLAAVQSIFAGTASFITGMGPGLEQATTGFLSLGQAFEPVADKVGAQFGGMLGQIGQAFTDTFKNGQLTQLISTFGDILEGLGKGLNPLIQGLIEIGNIVGPTIGPLFEQIGLSFKELAPALGNIGATFLTTLTEIMPDLTKFIDALLTGLEPVLPVIGDLLQSMLGALTPLVGPLSQVAQIVGTVLSQAITALAPSLPPLADAFVSLVNATAPLLPMVAEVAAGILSALAPALKTIFDALGPVIKQWSDSMLPVFRELAPILADVAMKLGTAIADALIQISPYIPDIAQSFGDLVLAIAPLLPQIVELAVDQLPPLIDLFIAILPTLLDMIDAFTWFVKNVVEPLVIPAMEKMSDVFIGTMNFATDAVNTAHDTLGSATAGIGEFFTAMSWTVSKAWEIIVKTIKSSVTTIGIFLLGLPEIEIPDLPGIPGRGTKVGFRGVGQAMVDWGTKAMATGGLLRGQGTGTSDSMLIAASTGEYIVNAHATSKNTPLLEALNNGWVPSADFLRMMLLANGRGFSGGGVVTDSEKARMGGGTVNLSIWQAIKSKFPNATLNSAKTDHDVDGGFHPKGDAIDVGPDRAVLDYLWSNRDQLAQIIFDDPTRVWYNVNGERAEGAKARAIYTEKTMKQHGDHIHVAALKEFRDSTLGGQKPGAVDNRTDKQKVTDEIVAVGKSMGASDAAITAALATGLVESNLANINHGPDGSTGVFQQRDFQEWTKGGTRDRNKVSDSARTFFEKFNETDASLSPGQRAQAVQRSAFPDKYDARMAEAGQLYQESQARSAAASSGGSSTSGTGTGDALPVFVTNMPGGATGFGGPATSSGLAGTATTLGPLTDSAPGASTADALKSATTPATPATPEEALRAAIAATPSATGTPEEEALRATLAATPPPGTPRPPAPGAGPGGAQGGHPLANLPIPGFDKLFAGPAPWYMAATPEAAVANLGTQAASLAQRTGSDVMGFFQNNWKEMLNTGLAVAGMGAGGGGGAPQMIVNNTGMDPNSAAAAVERVVRRRTLANQRGGGFGR